MQGKKVSNYVTARVTGKSFATPNGATVQSGSSKKAKGQK